MEFFLAWLILASVQFAATISPGPAFAVAVRNALAYDRTTGIYTAIGLGIGVAIHVMLVLGGLATILSQSVWLFNAIKYAGAAYLIYIGIKAIKTKKQLSFPSESDIEKPAKKTITRFKALQIGVLTNLLNPKAIVFFTALFTQFVAPGTSMELLALYGGTSVIIEIAWFSLVALILTNPKVKAKFMGIAHWIERVCGGMLVALGIRLTLP